MRVKCMRMALLVGTAGGKYKQEGCERIVRWLLWREGAD